jgi:hypothetical protein
MDLLAVYAQLLCCRQVFTLENIVDSLFSNIYKVIPPICILTFNLFRNIQIVQVHKNCKDAIQALWRGVSNGYFYLEKYLSISSTTDTLASSSRAGKEIIHPQFASEKGSFSTKLSTLMEEELLHNNAVIPDAPPPAPLQHAPPPQRPGDSSILPPPPSPAVKWRARPRLALHGRCAPPDPLGAARAAARPSLGVKLPSLESVTSTELQPASAIAVCCPASARAGPRRINQNVDIEAQNVDVRICF